MGFRTRTAGPVWRFVHALIAAVVIVWGVGAFADLSAQGDGPGRISLFPCRLVVKPTLLGVVEDGWRRSPTLQRQCRTLADARAVVALEWGRADAQLRAINRMRLEPDGVVVANVSVPSNSDTIELVAHELEHVIERTEGLDYAAESKRPGSGVWETRGTRGIFETQRAIDAGRQAAQELRDTPRGSR